MPDLRYRWCRQCERSADECGPLSWTRLCADCGKANFIANLDQLIEHRGPYFQHHRRACVAAFGGVVLDDPRERT